MDHGARIMFAQWHGAVSKCRGDCEGLAAIGFYRKGCTGSTGEKFLPVQREGRFLLLLEYRDLPLKRQWSNRLRERNR